MSTDEPEPLPLPDGDDNNASTSSSEAEEAEIEDDQSADSDSSCNLYGDEEEEDEDEVDGFHAEGIDDDDCELFDSDSDQADPSAKTGLGIHGGEATHLEDLVKAKVKSKAQAKIDAKEAASADRTIPLDFVLNKISQEGVIMQHHTGGFDSFLKYTIPSSLNVLTVKWFNQNCSYKGLTTDRSNINFEIKFTNVYAKPQWLTNITVPRRATPSDCRRMGLTYSLGIYVDMEVNAVLSDSGERATKPVEYKGKYLFTLPNLVQSATCILRNRSAAELEELGESGTDLGGYFIINGMEKVLVSQEVSAYNILQASVDPDERYSHYGLLRTIQDEDDPFPKKLKFYSYAPTGPRRGAIIVEMSGLQEGARVPLAILFKALGVVSDQQIADLIMFTDRRPIWLPYIRATLADGAFIQSQDTALLYISKLMKVPPSNNKYSGGRSAHENMVSGVMSWLYRDFLPMIIKDGLFGKAQNLGMYTLKFLKVVSGEAPETDRESQTVKRFNATGDLLAQVLRDALNDYRGQVITRISKQAQKAGEHKTLDSLLHTMFSQEKFRTIFEDSSISNVFMSSFGNDWGMRKKRASDKAQRQAVMKGTNVTGGVDDVTDEVGVVQDLNRLSYFGYLSHCRRTNYALSDTVKLRRPRELHNSLMGYICHIDVSDGTNLGRLKNMAVATTITCQLPEEERTAVRQLIDRSIEGTMNITQLPHGGVKVFIDGSWRGFTMRPHELVHRFRLLRSVGVISKWMNIHWDVDGGEIDVRMMSGRLTRLVINVNGSIDAVPHHGGVGLLNGIESLTQSGSSEFYKKLTHHISAWDWIDVVEMQNCTLAFNHNTKEPHITHIECHPSTLHSFNANLIPFASHNSTIRPLYACAQLKQTLHVYTSNYTDRMDSVSYVMNSAAMPLVSTAYEQINNMHTHPNGRDIMTMVVAGNGYSQEDGLVVSRSAVERGLFMVSAYHTFKYEEETNADSGVVTRFNNPKRFSLTNNLEHLRTGSTYDNLDDNGFPQIGYSLHRGDPFVGLVKSRPHPMSGEIHTDETVMVGDHMEGIVDKVVVYRKTGNNTEGERVLKIRTVTHRIIAIGDKLSFLGMKGVVCAIRDDVDMPFLANGTRPDIILSPQGFPTRLMCGLLLYGSSAQNATRTGRRSMGTIYTTPNPDFVRQLATNTEREFFDPRTGAKCEGTCYITPSYYYRIKQQATDKIFYMNDNSHVSTLTRQAIGGRSKHGGLRLGHMEMTCLVGQGISSTVHECAMKKADKHYVAVDGVTGNLPLTANMRTMEFNTNDIAGVRMPIKAAIPYSTKTFMQELECAGVATHMFAHDDRSKNEVEAMYAANADTLEVGDGDDGDDDNV